MDAEKTPLPILDSTGRPARATAAPDCPTCGASSQLRIASGGFGTPHPVCRRCGHEFHDEVWR